MRAFKIWNSFRLLPLVPYIFIALVTLACSFLLDKNPLIMWNVFAIIIFILSFAIPLLIVLAAKTEINYDGERILAKTVFRKREIILNDVKQVDFVFHEGTRISKNYIELKFFYTVDSYCLAFSSVLLSSEEDNYISLFDPVNVSSDRLIKGDYSEVNLLLLYHEIIESYPDKNAKNASELLK